LECVVNPQDRLDKLLSPFWGHEMFWGTMRWLLCLAAFAAAGGIVVWLVERH
jgi:hypothetical protein